MVQPPCFNGEEMTCSWTSSRSRRDVKRQLEGLYSKLLLFLSGLIESIFWIKENHCVRHGRIQSWDYSHKTARCFGAEQLNKLTNVQC